ncbi:Cytochrome c oxidase subunit 7A [Cytospora mali]|uniref:Cytochrome c oxidase subunit 9, mitochondrial n=1 Tax=Cytospora mali TaxID=578113 RepID=A0A194UUQ5_CYTMA|nr:Cytochrome c oxidase subunit 7A [Valsa mali var. pyri (nom. inval.)]
MAVKPIVGMLRRNLILDLGIALGLGFAMGNVFWYDSHPNFLRDLRARDKYGFHMPRTHARDNFYKALEEERLAKRG